MRPTTALLLLAATGAEDWVQKTNEQMEQAWPSSLDRKLSTGGACDADAALKTFQKCLKAQCPTIIDSRAATLYVFPAANETASTCQEARELPAFRDACCASQLIEYACGHHRSYVGEGAKGYQQAKAMALQKRNSLKWVEGEDYDDSGCRDAWRAVVECVWHNGVTNKGLDCDMTCPEPRTPAPSMAPSSTNQIYPTKMPTMPESHLEKCPCSSDWGWDRKSLGNGWADGSGKPGSHEGGADPNDPDHWRCRHALGGGPGGSGRRGGPRPKSEGQEGTKKAKGRYNGHRGECGPRLPDEGRAAGGPRSANADLYPPCAVNAALRSAPGVALLLFAALFVA